jgi:hypothetical protein
MVLATSKPVQSLLSLMQSATKVSPHFSVIASALAQLARSASVTPGGVSPHPKSL